MRFASCLLVGFACALLPPTGFVISRAGEDEPGMGLLDVNVTFDGIDGAVRPLGDVRVDLHCANLTEKSLRGSTDATGQVRFEAPYGKCWLNADSPGVVDGRKSLWQRDVELGPEKVTVDFSSENDVLFPVPPRHNQEPVYPKSARKARIWSGKVILQAVIGVDGLVTEVEVVDSTNAVFNESAIEFVKKRKYKPALQNGQPVACHFTIRVDFGVPTIRVP